MSCNEWCQSKLERTEEERDRLFEQLKTLSAMLIEEQKTTVRLRDNIQILFTMREESVKREETDATMARIREEITSLRVERDVALANAKVLQEELAKLRADAVSFMRRGCPSFERRPED